MAESFFATLECELIDRRSFRSHAEGRMAVFQYIEGWYNPWWRHTGLGYESPMSFERKYGHAATSRSEDPLSVLSARDSEASRKTTRQDAPGSTIALSSDLRVPLLSGPAPAVDSSTTGSVTGLASLYSTAP